MTHPIILADADHILSRVDLGPLRGKSVYVTGAAGLIGTTLCAVLRKAGAILIEHPWFPRDREKYNYVIHAAGYSAPAKFTSDPLSTIALGAQVTANLFRHYLAPGGTFLFLSSSEIYSGSKPPHHENSIGTITPDHPRACYVFGKLAGETICHAYRNRGVNAKIARVCLSYGPGTRGGDSRALNQFIQQALTTGRIVLKDAGLATRAYCYVSATVEMLLSIMLYGKQDTYNVGDDSSLTSIRELARIIGHLTNAEVVPPAITPADEKWAPGAVKVSVYRYIQELGIPDYVALHDGLAKTIAFQRDLYGVTNAA